MVYVLNKLAVASQRAPGLRSFQFMNSNDLHKLEAFFLSFDFDQRRAYFGGGVSDQSVRNYCGMIDWDHTTAIARTGPYCPEAIALVGDSLSVGSQEGWTFSPLYIGRREEECLRRHVAPLGETICFASAFAPSKHSFLCSPFSMFSTISGNLLLARSKPRGCNCIGFWYSFGTDRFANCSEACRAGILSLVETTTQVRVRRRAFG